MHDFVMECVFSISPRDVEPRQGAYETRNEGTIEWALTGPWPSCPRCSRELVQRVIERPTLGLLWTVVTAHVAPCGRRCLPGLDSWIEGGPPHVSMASCEVCRA